MRVKKRMLVLVAVLVILVLSALNVEYGAEKAKPMVSPIATPKIESTETSEIITTGFEKVLHQEYAKAESSISVTIYTFTDMHIADYLVEAKVRGIDVRVIVDGEQVKLPEMKAVIAVLRKNDIPVEKSIHRGIMHRKESVIDGRTVLTGSFNYTKAAETVNDENMVRIRSEKVASGEEKTFEHMWTNSQSFEAIP